MIIKKKISNDFNPIYNNNNNNKRFDCRLAQMIILLLELIFRITNQSRNRKKKKNLSVFLWFNLVEFLFSRVKQQQKKVILCCFKRIIYDSKLQ